MISIKQKLQQHKDNKSNKKPGKWQPGVLELGHTEVDREFLLFQKGI